MIRNNQGSGPTKPEDSASGTGHARSRGQATGNRGFPWKYKFKGACEALGEYVFDVTNGRNIDKFSSNVKALANHVGQKFTDGGDIRFTIKKMKKFEIEEPEKLKTLPSEFEREVWKRQVAEWVRRDAQLKNNIRLAYSLVWGAVHSDDAKQD